MHPNQSYFNFPGPGYRSVKIQLITINLFSSVKSDLRCFLSCRNRLCTRGQPCTAFTCHIERPYKEWQHTRSRFCFREKSRGSSRLTGNVLSGFTLQAGISVCFCRIHLGFFFFFFVQRDLEEYRCAILTFRAVENMCVFIFVSAK